MSRVLRASVRPDGVERVLVRVDYNLTLAQVAMALAYEEATYGPVRSLSLRELERVVRQAARAGIYGETTTWRAADHTAAIDQAKERIRATGAFKQAGAAR